MRPRFGHSWLFNTPGYIISFLQYSYFYCVRNGAPKKVHEKITDYITFSISFSGDKCMGSVKGICMVFILPDNIGRIIFI